MASCSATNVKGQILMPFTWNLFLSDYLGPDKWRGQDHQCVQHLQGAHFPQLTRPPYSIWSKQFKNLAILFWRLSWELPRVIGVTFVWAGLLLKQFHFFSLFLSLKMYSEMARKECSVFSCSWLHAHQLWNFFVPCMSIKSWICSA